MRKTYTLEVEGQEGYAGKLSSTASHVRDSASEVAKRALGEIDEQRENTASALEGAAAKIHAAADAGAGKISSAMHSAAGGIESAAAFLREHDTRRMISGVERLIRRHPARSLLIAAGIGFLTGLALKDSSAQRMRCAR
jgi:ElaB/YqjD/DUF883 family membrane-anchored ribosome-binding protein